MTQKVERQFLQAHLALKINALGWLIFFHLGVFFYIWLWQKKNFAGKLIIFRYIFENILFTYIFDNILYVNRLKLSWLYIPLKEKNECNQIRFLFKSDQWFQLLTRMQAVNVKFKPRMVSFTRDTIIKLKNTNKPLTSFNVQQVNRIVQKNLILQQTSQEYLSDLGNFS